MMHIALVGGGGQKADDEEVLDDFVQDKDSMYVTIGTPFALRIQFTDQKFTQESIWCPVRHASKHQTDRMNPKNSKAWSPSRL